MDDKRTEALLRSARAAAELLSLIELRLQDEATEPGLAALCDETAADLFEAIGEFERGDGNE